MTGAGDASALGHGPIDVHAHFLPEGYRAALREAGHDQPDGFPFIPEWSAAEHVAMMDRQGIATSMLSISSPGVHLDGGLLTHRFEKLPVGRHVFSVRARDRAGNAAPTVVWALEVK